MQVKNICVIYFLIIEEFVYFVTAISNPCSSNPCLHAGICLYDGLTAYQCSCADYYSGTNCELGTLF